MNLKEFKELVAKIPDKHDKLETGFYIITDDIADVGEAPVLDALTFQDWKHADEYVKETIDFLFYLN